MQRRKLFIVAGRHHVAVLVLQRDALRQRGLQLALGSLDQHFFSLHGVLHTLGERDRLFSNA
jgi:hypothetical protein